MNSPAAFCVLQFGIVLCLSGFAHGFSFSLLLSEIDNLKEYYNASQPDVAEDGPLFVRVLRDAQQDEKKVILSQIISMYLDIFSTLEDNHVVKESMGKIRESMVQWNQTHGFKKLGDLQKLIKTPVTDAKIQRKAVHELFWVVQNLYNMTGNSGQRKKRRSRQRISKY
ncbi:interferon gamma [Tachyglossus aculeatus]|uniref:interferon gamma n=1 Tax=Tachyglossus aculeatus TaxID=9261 RepID=UPI0018F6D02B|nr:interferon gamma [Tachyglossus aculeatus]